jgi:DNA polymerase-1
MYDPYAYYREIESPVARVFQKMEARGVCIDTLYLRQLQAELEAQFKPLDEEIKQKLGVQNVNSDKQVIDALDKRFGLNFELKGKATRSKVALEKAADIPIVALLLKHSELGTLLDTFVYKYLDRGVEVVHPFFNQCGTRTGRPSCSNPNLLQIPKRTDNGRRVRRMFIPRRGFTFYDSDYKQIEPWVLAVLSQDKDMLHLFSQGIDFHTYFASGLGIDRDKAKVFDLETYYFATKYGVAHTLKCSEEQAQKEIEKAWNLFPGLRVWAEKLTWETKRKGYIETLFGRRIKIDRLDSPIEWQRNSAKRQMMNNMAQASAGEVIKKGMIRIANDSRFSRSFGLMIQIYDALAGETENLENDKLLIIEGMEKAVDLGIPLRVDFKSGPNWADVK